MERLPDLEISGMGKMDGGHFNQINISGLGQISGDVEAERIVISGKGTINGNAAATHKIMISGMGTLKGHAKAGKVLSSGTAYVEGNLNAEDIEASGNLKVGGDVLTQHLSNDGRCRVGHHVKAHKIVSRGFLSVAGDLEAEEYDSKGSFSIDGLLNANVIDVEIHGFCYAKEIGGEAIQVKLSRYHNWTIDFFSKLINPFLGNNRELDKLNADLIEGTSIALENTHAKVVRGNQVKIGPNCEIELVEYTESIEIDASSIVQQNVKVI